MQLDPLGDWKRSDYLEHLGKADLGRQVTLMGWVHSRRDHGGVIFVDLRDHTGMAQVVFGPQHNQASFERAQELRSEYVVAIKGEVVARSTDQVNLKMKTGEI